MLSVINRKARNGQLVHIRMEEDSLGQSFGIIDRGRDYYVYAFVSEKNVFGSTPRNLLWIAMAYFLIFALLGMIRWRMDRQFQKEQRAREQDYQKELEEAAHKAESANIAKTEFLQRMSHDIRTPINGIRGMVEIGNYYSNDLIKQAECRKKIWDASGLLLELINEVLDMGKMESGEVILEERSFQVVDLVQEIVDVLEKQAAERGVTITCKEVCFEDGKAWLEFICADTGIGMSEEFQQHFDAILMDVMMPVMDGYEATKAIRALNRKDAKKIPILAMTANAFAEDRRKALIAGMNEHLTKPLESEKVLRALAACCAKRSYE